MRWTGVRAPGQLRGAWAIDSVVNVEVPSTSPSSPLAPSVQPAAGAASWLGGASLALSFVALAWFFVVLVRDVEAADFTRLDAASSRLDVGPGWVDPRWEREMSLELARLPELDADSTEAQEAVRGVLLSLPFIAEIGTTRVLWPDGLRVDVRLRQPIACVRTGEWLLAVSEDGVVLPGLWSAPPARERGFLPLIALDDGSRAEIFEGARVTSAPAVDGLAVATVLWQRLQADDWVRIGRIVLDARRARETSVEEPGVVIWMEGGRRVYFGRSPAVDAPGELPFDSKCASLSRALRLFDAGAQSIDWELADVRWDRPEILPRGGLDDPSNGRGAIR